MAILWHSFVWGSTRLMMMMVLLAVYSFSTIWQGSDLTTWLVMIMSFIREFHECFSSYSYPFLVYMGCRLKGGGLQFLLDGLRNSFSNSLLFFIKLSILIKVLELPWNWDTVTRRCYNDKFLWMVLRRTKKSLKMNLFSIILRGKKTTLTKPIVYFYFQV